ncbi:MAG: metal-dependent hydrolase [Acidobacteriota bacterium]
MPTIFTHSAFALGATKLAIEQTDKRIMLAGGLLAALPDADALLMRWIAYGDGFGHRGFTHSLFFAVVMGCAVAFLFLQMKWHGKRRFVFLAGLFSLVTASHGFFDALTTGGLGVAFFAPFDNTRYFFPIRPIPVAPLSASGLFTAKGFNLLLWEFLLVWIFMIGAFIWTHKSVKRKIVAVIFWFTCALMWWVKFSA